MEDLQVDQQVRAYYTKTDNVAVAVIIAKVPGSAPAPAPATNTVRVAGQLTKIDGNALTITTTADNETTDTVITCNDSTKFSRDGAGPVKFEDLQVDQPVRAYYTKTDNVAVAVIIAKAPTPLVEEKPAP